MGVEALFSDQQGVLDWHRKLIGSPHSLILSESRSSLKNSILVYSNKNILANLNLKTGSIAWRKSLDNESPLILVSHDISTSLVFSLKSPNVFVARLFDSSSGFLLWQSKDITSDLIVTPLNVFSVVSKSYAFFTHSNSDANVYAISQIGSGSFLVTVFSEYQDNSEWNFDVGSGAFITVDDGLIVLKNGQVCKILLDNQQNICEEISGLESIQNINKIPGLSSHFVAILENGNTIIVDDTLNKIKHFENPRNTEIHYIGSQISGVPYIIRIQETSLKSIGEFFTPTTKLSEFTLPHLPSLSGRLSTLSLNLYQRKDNGKVAFRVLASTQDGSIHLWRGSEVIWTREESLTHIVDEVFVELPEPHGFSENRDELHELHSKTEALDPLSRYLKRISVHVGSAFISKSKVIANSTALVRDTFGIKKILLVVTSTGKLIALNTLTGENVWAKMIGPGVWSLEVVRDVKIGGLPVVVVVGRLNKKTILKELDPLNGDIFFESELDIEVSRVDQLEIEDERSRNKVLALTSVDQKVWLYPSTPQIHESFQKISSSMYLYIADDIGGKSVVGFVIDKQIEDILVNPGLVSKIFFKPNKKHYTTKQTWSFHLAESEEIAAITSKTREDITPSIGRVLGNRQVLYKYLNPHLLAISAVASTATSSHLSFYLLDTVTGALLYHAMHPGAGYITSNSDVGILVSENWVVYYLFNHGPDFVKQKEQIYQSEEAEEESGDEEAWKVIEDPVEREKERVRKRMAKRKADEKKKKASVVVEEEEEITPVSEVKGVQVVVLELFEDVNPDVRVISDEFSSVGAKRPSVLSKAFVFPQQILGLGVTRTRYGITIREILCKSSQKLLNANLTNFKKKVSIPNSIFGVSKRQLDPRRPTTLTAFDKEEELIQYKPAIELIDTNVASYDLEVIGAKKIVGVATLLESTSLVVAYGIDLWSMRRMPSKTFDLLSEDFGYLNLVGTVVVLVIAVGVVRGLVARKRLADAWA
ncbi:hypothetical protein HK096_011246 [Nowakowskiella sp. JEL0078]|nr:hypothetical protein HK096_011246 [Nowakowskiella sp. JEL0078]